MKKVYVCFILIIAIMSYCYCFAGNTSDLFDYYYGAEAEDYVAGGGNPDWVVPASETQVGQDLTSDEFEDAPTPIPYDLTQSDIPAELADSFWGEWESLDEHGNPLEMPSSTHGADYMGHDGQYAYFNCNGQIWRIPLALYNKLFGPTPVPPKNSGKFWITVTQLPDLNYRDLDAGIQANLMGKPYDIQKGIPTSENLYCYESAKKAMHDINVKCWRIMAGVTDLTINVFATWSEKCPGNCCLEEYDNCNSVGRDCCKRRGYHDGRRHRHETSNRKVVEHWTETLVDWTIYSIEKVDIYSLQKGIIKEICNDPAYKDYEIDYDARIKASVNNPGTRIAKVNMSPKKPESPTRYSVWTGPDYSTKKQAEQHRDAYTAEEAKAKVRAACVKAAENAVTKKWTNEFKYGETGYIWFKNYKSNNSTVGERGVVMPNVERDGYTGRVKKTDKHINIFQREYYPEPIPSYFINGGYSGTAYAYYTGNKSSSKKVRDLVIHTPVVNKSELFDNETELTKQKISYDINEKYLTLDSSFYIRINESGTHRQIPGYNVRSYNSYQGENGKRLTNWGLIEDVKLPFDVYVHEWAVENNKYVETGVKKFLPANTWLSEKYDMIYSSNGKQCYLYVLDGNNLVTDDRNMTGRGGFRYFRFTLPVWVKEKKYHANGNALIQSGVIQTRVVAENAVDALNGLNANNMNLPSGKYDRGLNNNRINMNDSRIAYGSNSADTSKYIAIDNINCEVIGQIYDLRINATNDPGWTDIFSSSTNQDYISGGETAFGQSGQNRRGQTYQYAPKLGYTFVYNVKTKGRKSDNLRVKIDENGGFFFVPATGDKNTPVETVTLFYKPSGSNAYKQVLGNSVITVTLSDSFMEVPAIEMTNSSTIYPKEFGASHNGVPLPYTYSVGEKIDTTNGEMIIPHKLRLVYDNFAEYISKNDTTNTKQANISYTDENGKTQIYDKVYVNDNLPVLEGYGTNNTKADIADHAKSTHTISTLGIVDANETGNEIVLGSVGHWWVGYRLPSSTIAINSNDVKKIVATLYNVGESSVTNAMIKEALNKKPNDIVILAQQQNLVHLDGYIGVKMLLNTKTTDNSELNNQYLQYLGPEVTNIFTGERNGQIYYDYIHGDLYHTFTGDIKATRFTIGESKGGPITLPNGNEVFSTVNNGLLQTIKLPNGRKQDIPAGTLGLFEVKYDASVDRVPGSND